jgi:hypothetical protein
MVERNRMSPEEHFLSRLPVPTQRLVLRTKHSELFNDLRETDGSVEAVNEVLEKHGVYPTKVGDYIKPYIKSVVRVKGSFTGVLKTIEDRVEHHKRAYADHLLEQVRPVLDFITKHDIQVRPYVLKDKGRVGWKVDVDTDKYLEFKKLIREKKIEFDDSQVVVTNKADLPLTQEVRILEANHRSMFLSALIRSQFLKRQKPLE